MKRYLSITWRRKRGSSVLPQSALHQRWILIFCRVKEKIHYNNPDFECSANPVPETFKWNVVYFENKPENIPKMIFSGGSLLPGHTILIRILKLHYRFYPFSIKWGNYFLDTQYTKYFFWRVTTSWTYSNCILF